jgi:CubicO group peptidase (beta-lactamase class C family)
MTSGVISSIAISIEESIIVKSRSLRNHHLFVFFCILLFTSPTFAVGHDDKVDAYITQQMAKYKIPGLSVAVVKHEKIVKLKGYGYASVEFDVPASEQTVYQLFSVSKIFAAVGVMKLVESGELTLDMPVTEIIKELPTAWRTIRIRHLLTHTSGLPEMSANPRFACLPAEQKRTITVDEELRLIAEVPLKFQPGEKFSYHQSGYRLLGKIIERLAKKSYAGFLKENVFVPLGMTATQFGGTEAAVIKWRSPASYNRESGELRGWLYPFTPRDYPAAGLNSSAVDLAKFFSALAAGKFLKPESLRNMWSAVRLNDGSEKAYGLGWTVDQHKGLQVVGHEGGGAIWVAHFPTEHLSIIVLCNLNGARADEIQYGLADLYLSR